MISFCGGCQACRSFRRQCRSVDSCSHSVVDWRDLKLDCSHHDLTAAAAAYDDDDARKYSCRRCSLVFAERSRP